jgi:oligopeptide/dipeptide ABC transporter ATP-binding protein
MYRGRIVELAAAAALFSSPAHPYTRALLSATPVPDPDHRPARIEWNSEGIDLKAQLREVGDEHYAAI